MAVLAIRIQQWALSTIVERSLASYLSKNIFVYIPISRLQRSLPARERSRTWRECNRKIAYRYSQRLLFTSHESGKLASIFARESLSSREISFFSYLWFVFYTSTFIRINHSNVTSMPSTMLSVSLWAQYPRVLFELFESNNFIGPYRPKRA